MLINSAFRDNSNHSFSHHYHLAAIFAASMEENSVSDHKLCGFLCVVLVTKRSQVNPLDLSNTLRFGTRCHIFGEGSEIGFLSDTGVVLSPLNLPDSARDSKNCENVAKVEGVQLTRKRKRRVGLVRGSISVVTQLHALVMHKCLAILARVVRVDVSNEKAEAKVEVLVDAYFPIALWSGWQFPRSGTTAAALCRHLSCDWTKRNLILGSANGDNCMSDYEDEKSISDFSPCHVLGCKLHCSIPDSSKKKLFELDEVFKSLPRVTSGEIPDYSRVKPANAFSGSGICDISDDILINIFASLGPRDLVKVSATCHHLRLLAASIMPCMKLKLFPHQQAAVEWMLLRERNPEALPHPLYMNFVTEDGFCFYVNAVSGEIVTGLAPTIRDFRGGMFCDEPGLGKTITALSLILKTQGTLADPPDGAQVIWCTHNAEQRCGYYEINTNNFMNGSTPSAKRFLGQNPRRGQLSLERINLTEDLNYLSPEQSRLMALKEQITGSNDIGLSDRHTLPEKNVVRCPRRLSQVKRNLLHAYEGRKPGENSCKRLHAPNDTRQDGLVFASNGLPYSCKKNGNASVDVCIDTWVQCDACHKWRRLPDASKADDNTVWFCSMNTDLSYQRCNDPEESWDDRQSITYFPGFYARGTAGRKEQNISFFTSVLKEHYTLMNSETRKSLTWLASLSPEKLSQMETIGLVQPIADTRAVSNGGALTYHKIFHAFGLVRKVEKGISRWFYPPVLSNMIFDLAAFRVALCKPLDWCRLYLSTATLIVVPSNLIDHWKTQIQKHVRPGQLQVYVWSDHKKPSAHNLAWDYDVVITTFNRLSAEWGPRKRSVLMQVHWLRVMLDEGHTLGSSLNLTNKLQMAVSLMASRRWILTGTPTPNTPNSQLSHLQPILKFLHEEAYGLDQKSWEAGILRLFEAEMEDGRSRLLQLLHRCMISARKVDLQTIPHCIKKATLLDFTEEHAKSYNELVATVRRNILMADWNDPSHVESLLNPKQWKFRSTTIRNVRLSCCVAGHIKVTDAGQDIQETMDILVGNGLNPASEEYVYIKHNLLYGGNCLRCKEWCRLPIITPCRHLLCLDCIALDSEKCPFPGCGCLYEMQSPEILARPENPSPKWPVPKDLIELQPSYKQDDWDPDWQSTSSSKVRYLVQRLKTLQEANGKLGCSMGDDKGSMHADKLQFSHKNCNLHVCLPFYSSACNEPYKMLPDKVIIFSQFLEHIHVIGQQLTIAGIKFAGMYSPMHSSNKMKSLAIFQNDASCMALLMDGSAALGLDLSFVTHVFLMEPIWDRSVEEQVVSRAHRMGATRPVHVETLAMHGTIEEQMLEFLQDANGCRKKYLNEKFGKSGNEGARPHRTLHDFAESGYLARLSSVCTSAKV